MRALQRPRPNPRGCTQRETLACVALEGARSVARVKRALTLKHQGNLGEPVEEVKLSAGEEVTVLHQFAERILFKTSTGQMFTAPKDVLEL